MNNASLTENKTGNVALTPAELWIQLVVFYGLLCGVITSVCSVLVWTGIARSRKLRNRFYVIVGCLTFCRTGICLQFLVMALYRSLRTAGVVSPEQRRVVCHAIHFWLIIGWTVEMFLLLFLVVDRCIAIVACVYYRQLRYQSALYLCLFIYFAVGCLKLVPSYTMVDLNEVVSCVNLYSAPSARFNNFSQDIDFIMVGVILFVYFGLIIFVRCRTFRMRRGISDENMAANKALQRQMTLMPVLRNLVLMHCGLALSSKLLLTLGVILPVKEIYKQRLTALGGIMGCIDVFSNVVVLLFGNTNIRTAGLSWLQKRLSRSDRTTTQNARSVSVVPVK